MLVLVLLFHIFSSPFKVYVCRTGWPTHPTALLVSDWCHQVRNLMHDLARKSPLTPQVFDFANSPVGRSITIYTTNAEISP